MSLSTKLKITVVVAAALWAMLWVVPVGSGADGQKVADGRLASPVSTRAPE